MRIIRDYLYVEPQDRGASAAIGNFDGVHIGHQSVIELARREGAAMRRNAEIRLWRKVTGSELEGTPRVLRSTGDG